jgi:plasmid stabilization system protein ParE
VSYKVRIAEKADDDLRRLYAFLYERDPLAADKARAGIAKGLRLLEDFPLSCRKASSGNPFLRELVISFGYAGYVALFEITDDATVTVLAVRYQRERDYL